MPPPDPNGLIALLEEPDTSEDRAFEIAKGISYFFNSEDDRTGRELVIRALDRTDIFARLPSILDALARQAGLFPYTEPAALSPRDQVAYEYHRPDALRLRGQEVVFHREQAEIYRDLLAHQSVVLSAPTSFGKSVIVDALLATDEYSIIVIIVPTISLIDETRRRLAQFHDRYKIVTHSTQPRGGRTIFILTQERAVDRTDLDEIDLLVIDEFYKLDPGREPENDRCTTLNQAFYKLARRATQLYLLGPSIREIPDDFGSPFRCVFKRTDYNTVVSKLHRVAWRPDRGGALIRLCRTLTDPTLIYCKSPAQAHLVAKLLVGSELGIERPILGAAAAWIGHEYHPAWSFVAALDRGIGLHHGGIPRALSQLNVALFNSGQLPFLVCTSTLIEGVNTAAKNVVLYENKIATSKLDFFTFNNIKGRSGRMFQHFIGNVYVFDDAPQENLDVIDVPLFSQGKNVPLGLLVQMQDEDLTPEFAARLEPIRSQRTLSLTTIQANSPIDPNDQIRLAADIRKNARGWYRRLSWIGYPEGEQLEFCCKLIYDYFVKRPRDGVSSGRQLAYRLGRLRATRSVRGFIEEVLQRDTRADGQPDAAVQIALEFQRKWATFNFPRLLIALERIQEEILIG